MDNSVVAPVLATDHAHEQKVISTPPKSSKGGWQAAIFIIFVEIAERFAYYGLAGNLITYLTNDLGQQLATAAKNVNTWVGVSSIFPLLGALVADSYLGRFKTILVSSIIYLLGMIVLTLSVSIVPSSYRKAVFFTALYVLAIGEGGHKPCVQTFAADQFSEDTPEERKAKSSFFNWWYLGIVFGATSATWLVIYLQDNVSWTAGLSTLAAALAGGLVLFLIGMRTYRKEAPMGSPFTRVAQVFVAAAKKRRVDERGAQGICYEEGTGGAESEGQCKVVGTLLARTHQFRCLDKAMIVDEQDACSSIRNPWRLCTQNQVEEAKLILRLIPIWLSCLMYTVVISQTHTFFTKQGSTMVRSLGPHFQIPPGSLLGFVGITIIIAVPIYDRVFVPIARKITGHPSGITMLQRIGFGLFLSILNMVVSALVEAKRVGVARDHGLMDNPKAVLPIRVWWLLPQYMITGLTDMSVIIGLQELFYDQMPEGLRSLGAAGHICIVGIGSLLSNVIIGIIQGVSSNYGNEWLGNNINRAHLDHFYWVLAGLCTVNLCLYLWITKDFAYKKVEVDGPSEEKLRV